MKYSIKHTVLFACLLAQTVVCAQKSPASSPMVFDNMEWDFGKIREGDGVVRHSFGFTNKGNEAFVVQEVAVSCGCTTPTFSRQPVKPGERGVIEIAYDPTDRPGGFVKEIHIIGSRSIQGTVLVIRGEVIGRPRSIEEDYPVAVSSALRLSARSENIDYVKHGTTMSRMIRYANNSDREIRVLAEVVPAVDYFRVTIPPVIAPHAKGEMMLTYDLRKVKPYGLLPVKIFFTVDGRRSDTPVSVTTRGIENFAVIDASKSPQCELSITYFNFGNIKKGESAVKEVTIANKGKSALVVRNIQPQDGITVTLPVGTVIEAGKSLAFRAVFDAATQPVGRAFGNVTITTNDPERPVREIRFVANVI